MPTTIHDIGGAVIRAYTNANGNEIAFDPKKGTPPDPRKIRFGIWDGEKAYACCFSLDLLTGDNEDPHRNERAFIALGIDDSSKAKPNDPVLLLEMAGAVDGSGEDYDMKTVIRISRSEGIELSLPLKTSGGVVGQANSNTVFRLMSHAKNWVVNVQDDRPDPVVYDTHGTDDETKWTAVGTLVLKPV